MERGRAIGASSRRGRSVMSCSVGPKSFGRQSDEIAEYSGRNHLVKRDSASTQDGQSYPSRRNDGQDCPSYGALQDCERMKNLLSWPARRLHQCFHAACFHVAPNLI
jgi:hypothetical protein